MSQKACQPELWRSKRWNYSLDHEVPGKVMTADSHSIPGLWSLGYNKDGSSTSRGFHIHQPPWWLSWQRIRLQCRRPGFDLLVKKIPWRTERLPTPVFWPGELHGLSPWGHKESDTTERLSFFTHSTGIPSLPLALFIVMLPNKSHLTLHSRVSDSR